MNVQKILLTSCVAACLIVPYSLHAAVTAQPKGDNEISVWPLEVDFMAGGKNYKDLSVINEGANKVYVKAVLTRLLNPGAENGKTLKLSNNPYQFGITVTPAKLVIPVGGRAYLRVLWLKHHVNKDWVYHISVMPVTNPVTKSTLVKKSVKGGVALTVGYGVRVTIRPNPMQPHVVLVRDGKHVTATNKGNTSIYLYDGKQCDTAHHCTNVRPVNRVYVGQSWKFTVPKAEPVVFKQHLAEKPIALVKSN